MIHYPPALWILFNHDRPTVNSFTCSLHRGCTKSFRLHFQHMFFFYISIAQIQLQFGRQMFAFVSCLSLTFLNLCIGNTNLSPFTILFWFTELKFPPFIWNVKWRQSKYIKLATPKHQESSATCCSRVLDSRPCRKKGFEFCKLVWRRNWKSEWKSDRRIFHISNLRIVDHNKARSNTRRRKCLVASSRTDLALISSIEPSFPESNVI